MSSAPSPDDIWKDARWLVQALDPHAGLVRLVEMSREAYRSASFLDDRLLQPGVPAQLVPWAPIAGSAPDEARTDARWIFHIGHVGSTLVARLLGELDGVLSIREPRSLRDAALVASDARAPILKPLQQLFSRTFSPGEVALVKATSFVSEIAAELVPSGQRALFLHAAPRAFVQGMLAGENSRHELQALSGFRAERMRDRVSGLDSGRSPAHAAAAAWACEMTSLEAAAEAIGQRHVLWQDFDSMLGSMEKALTEVAGFLQLEASAGRLAEVAAGPLMRLYSKDPAFEYSPGLRAELLAQAARQYRVEIDSAMAMLESVAAGSPLLARSLARAVSES